MLVLKSADQMDNHGPETIIKQPNWWRRRNPLERALVVLAAVCAILAIGLLIALLVTLAHKSDIKENMTPSTQYIEGKLTCTNPDCISAASSLLKNMNPAMDPCDDFYEFACGGFIKSSRIPDDKVLINSFSLITDELGEQLKALLEESPKDTDPRPFRLARDFYQACINTTAIEAVGTEPILEKLYQVGGWPVLQGDSWNSNGFSWVETIHKYRLIGYSGKYIMDYAVSSDMKNSTVWVINLDQPNLGLSREYLVKGKDYKNVEAYFTYMTDVAELLGANKSYARKEMSDVLDFEMKLAEMSIPQEKRRNITALYHSFTIKKLQDTFKSVAWKDFFNKILAPHVTVDDDEPIVVYSPDYLKQLEVLIKAVPARVQANYMAWRAVKDSVSFLSEGLRDRQLAYLRVQGGIKTREPRWKECVNHVSNSLEIAVGSMYVRKYFDDNSKNRALDMVNDIRTEFDSMLREVQWMDENTREAALDKAENMVNHIGYPQELIDDNKISEYYKELEITSDSFLRGTLNFSKFTTNYNYKRLRQPVNRTEWITHGQPAVVNAFYNSVENSIQFPAGILQGGFFSSNKPRYMNYGAIGFIIAHEVTHGFDDQGSQFDRNGNLLNWWAEETKARYLEKAQCIIDQYGNYTEKEVGLNLNGINTQGENIADNGGIKEVYRAYLRWVKRNGDEPGLPGLNYSPKQLFWLSAANIWCSVYRPETLKQQITLGVHSPGRFRVLGPISNMPQFGSDFNCPLGSKMNPAKKCSVW